MQALKPIHFDTTTDAFDVVVIGAGIAGLVTAVRAGELGLSCLVLEKGSGSYLCNTRITGGMFHICMANMAKSEIELLDTIQQARPDLASSEIAVSVAKNAIPALKWLRTQGIRLIKAMPQEAYWWVLAPPRVLSGDVPWQGRGGDVMLRQLEAKLLELSGVLSRQSHVLNLQKSVDIGFVVTAAVAEQTREYVAKNVVIADGGFQANIEMLRQYISPRPEAVFQRCAPTGVGDGIRMAQGLGAKLVGMDTFYGHVLSQSVFDRAGLWPYPIMDRVLSVGMAVQRNGLRFMDEGLGGTYQANQIAKLEDPLSTFAIFDSAIWRTAGKHSRLSCPNPILIKKGGRIFEASTIESLGQAAGIQGEALVRSVASYNQHVKMNTLNALEPARSTNKFTPSTILEAPFYAVPLCAGITYTMGGIATDGAARVLDHSDQVMEGLFAVGATTGGLEGGETVSYVGGLAKAATMGLEAAEAMARGSR
jgi:fumarate reductase flavoprotein subunit